MLIQLDSNYANGRIVNYSGIVRGGTQRIVKLHLLNTDVDEAALSVEKIMDGLIDGDDSLALPKAPDPVFRAAMVKVRSYWYDELKQEFLHKTGQHNPQSVLKKSEEFFVLTNEAVNAAEVHSAAGINHMKILSLCTLAVNLLCIIVIGLIVHKKILTPLNHLESGVARIAQGDLSVQIEYRSDDELGSLAESMRRMISKLSSYIKETRYQLQELSEGKLDLELNSCFEGDFEAIGQSLEYISSSLNTTIHGINISADQVAASSSVLAESFKTLVSGASREVQSMNTLSATVTDVSDKVGNTAQNASHARDMVQKVGEQIVCCGDQMQMMVQAMKQISEHAAEIKKVIKTIEEISFQTNILALNAAVEAARAGIAGKGFSVVADEVRTLANKSGESVKSTTGLVQEALESVENGTRLAARTADMLQDVISMTQDVVGSANSITDATKEQFLSIENIRNEIREINYVVSNNSIITAQSAAEGEELSEQANVLKNLVGHFRLKDQEYCDDRTDLEPDKE